MNVWKDEIISRVDSVNTRNIHISYIHKTSIFPHIHILIGSSLKKITYLMYRNDPLSGFVEQLLVIRNVCSIFYSFSHYVVEAKP